MSFDSLLRHSLVIKRLEPVLDGLGDPVLDDHGQATFAPTTFATVAGQIQPRPPGMEVQITTQSGVVVSKHIGYMRPLADLNTDCWIELTTPAHMAGRYDIIDLPDAAGLNHHLELPLVKVS